MEKVLINVVLEFCGFGVGIFLGLVMGYFLCIYSQSTDDKDPVICPFDERDSESLQQLLSEIQLWVKNPDHDRVDLLNKFLEYMWPYLDKVICKSTKDIATSIIAEQIPKYKLESVEFETLTLGSLPPTFQDMKVYETDENDLIMEPSLKWAGNPNITVAVKAFGLKATVQIVDFQIFAAPSITLEHLVPSFPFFAKINVSLMEKPHVDFGKLAGADLMSIPELYSFVQERIKDEVANMCLWPYWLELQILDLPTYDIVYFQNVSTILSCRKSYEAEKERFVPSIRHLCKTEAHRVKAIQKTNVQHKNLNPEWHEKFTMVVKDLESQALELHVYEWEPFGIHDKMGMNVVPLKELTPDEPKLMMLHLLKNMDINDVQKDKQRGQIEVELMYKPFKEDGLHEDFDDSWGVEKAPEEIPIEGGILVVVIHEARDVEGKHHTNPYVKIVFRDEEKKTKQVKKNRDPRWNMDFRFVLEEPPTKDMIHVEVWSTSMRIGLLHPKEKLGYVDISLSDVVSNKRTKEEYRLIDSKNGKIEIELQWRTSS